MLNSKAFANAATLVTAGFYIICLLLSLIAPDLLFSIANSWMHSISIESLKTQQPPSFTSILWGLVTISLVTWVITYTMIEIYKKLAKR